MKDIGEDRELQRLFSSYDPAIAAAPFVGRVLARLDREMRRARMRAAIVYVLAAILIAVLVATTATPLNGAISAVETTLRSLGSSLLPLRSQALIYGVTLALLVVARRPLRTFLAPW